MIRTQVYIPEDLHQELTLLAKQEGVNFSKLIREGAEEVVKRKKSKRNKKGLWKEFAGALKYGPKDLSTRVNDIYK